MSYQVPENLKYTQNHEWAKIENDTAIIGITDFAQSTLGDIVFAELPQVSSTIDKDGPFGIVESVKSVSDLYAPLTGEVIEVNDQLEANPDSLNATPYETWIIKIKISDPKEVEQLLDASKYRKTCEETATA